MFPSPENRISSLLVSLLVPIAVLSGCSHATNHDENAIPARQYSSYGDLVSVDGLVGTMEFPWSDYIVVNDTHLRIEISDTSENPCERATIDVVETSESVTISLHYGNLPDVDQSLCHEPDGIQTLAWSSASMMVELHQPLSDRTIIDGYNGSIGVEGAWSDLDKETLADFPGAMIP